MTTAEQPEYAGDYGNCVACRARGSWRVWWYMCDLDYRKYKEHEEKTGKPAHGHTLGRLPESLWEVNRTTSNPKGVKNNGELKEFISTDMAWAEHAYARETN